MTINLSAVILDAAELDPESSFWHRMLGGTVTKTATHHFLQIDGSPVFVIQLAPDHVPPQWPHDPSQHMHVDLAVDDLTSAVRLALGAGARRLQPTNEADPSSTTGSQVYSSPAGHPFCIRPA